MDERRDSVKEINQNNEGVKEATINSEEDNIEEEQELQNVEDKSENKVESIEEEPIVDKEENQKKSIIKVSLLLLLSLFAIMTVGTIIYLQLSTFKINYEEKSIATFLKENKILNTINKENNTVEVLVPDNVINTEIKKRFSYLPSNFKVRNVSFKPDNNKLYINSKVYKIGVPIVCTVDYVVKDGSIYLGVKDVSFGKSKISLIKVVEDYLVKNLLTNEFPIEISAQDLNLPKFFTIEKLEFQDKDMTISFKINEDMIKEEFSKIIGSANIDLLKLYKTSDSPIKQEAARLIENIDDFSMDTIQLLANDLMNNGELLTTIVTIIKDINIEIFFEKYGKYFTITREEVLGNKDNLIQIVLDNHYNDIMEKTNVYFANVLNETMYINKGKPYSCIEGSTITINSIVSYYGLEISDELLENMQFSYDDNNNQLLIAYKANKDKYYIIKKEGKEIISTNEYNNRFSIENTGKAEFVSDINKWNEIYSTLKNYFGIEDIYIRYMKADDKYAFVISSPKDDYQNYWSMALIKNEDNIWEIIDSDVKKIKALNVTYPDFNLETITSEIEKITIYSLSENTKELILDEMVVKGIIDDKSNIQIVYCSYDGNYIALKLSNNKEYIYKVYKMYLDTVYEKDVALKQWDNISDIISLQEEPK